MQGKIAVLTMTRHRHEQLLGQVDGISVGSVAPVVHSVVSMGDRDLTRGRLPLATDRWETVVRPVPTDRRAVPIAAARNLAAQEAIDLGADVLVFLDDAMIPGARTLERFAEAVAGEAGAQLRAETDGPLVWVGPVLDLPPAESPTVGYPMGRLHTLGVRTPGAPTMETGQLVAEPRWELFRGGAFAMSAADFRSTGGFHEGYTGHGLEDADFAEVVRRAGGGLVWVGGARAYRQPAPVEDRAHQTRIAINHARVWKERWGTRSEHPWLSRLVGEGALRLGDDDDYEAA